MQPSKFSSEIERLKNNREINQDSKLRQLNPYLDQEEILLVGGRLTTASIPHEAKHQLIPPKPYHISELIIKSQQPKNEQIRTENVLPNLRNKYWVVNECVTVTKVCFKDMFPLQKDECKKHSTYYE